MDKLIVKNYMQHEAHALAMKYFFEHEYDYFIISSDDVLGSPYHVRLLLRDERKHAFPVISGWCNLYLHEDVAAITTQRPNLRRKPITRHSYSFIPLKDMGLSKHGFPFMKAWYVGLPLTLIRREILEKVPLKPFQKQVDRFCLTSETKKRGRGVMFDLQFACDCAANKIPIMVDARIFLLHFSKTKRYVNVGREKPEVVFIKASR